MAEQISKSIQWDIPQDIVWDILALTYDILSDVTWPQVNSIPLCPPGDSIPDCGAEGEVGLWILWSCTSPHQQYGSANQMVLFVVIPIRQ